MTAAYVGLGANLGEPRRQVEAAIEELKRLPRTRVTGVSSLYRSAPVGGPPQPEYVNAAARLDTGLDPEALLDALLAIEAAHGRERRARNAPRTLDLDLLLYGGRVLAAPRLVLPHPRLHERAFVLAPLAELEPGLEVPGRGAVGALLAACAGQAVRRIDD